MCISFEVFSKECLITFLDLNFQRFLAKVFGFPKCDRLD